MNALDLDRLERVRVWAENEVEVADRQQRLLPLHEAMRKTFAATRSSVIPDMMAGPEAMVRHSVLNMERSQAEFSMKLAQQDADHQSRLDRLRSRTTKLRLWLEALA